MKLTAINEFRRLGLVVEINRRILHPLGLALQVSITDEPVRAVAFTAAELDTLERLLAAGGEIVDVAELDAVRARLAEGQDYALLAQRMPARRAALGYIVQPLEALTQSTDETPAG